MNKWILYEALKDKIEAMNLSFTVLMLKNYMNN
jgi:hypothetical protein